MNKWNVVLFSWQEHILGVNQQNYYPKYPSLNQMYLSVTIDHSWPVELFCTFTSVSPVDCSYSMISWLETCTFFSLHFSFFAFFLGWPHFPGSERVTLYFLWFCKQKFHYLCLSSSCHHWQCSFKISFACVQSQVVRVTDHLLSILRVLRTNIECRSTRCVIFAGVVLRCALVAFKLLASPNLHLKSA